MPSSPPQIPEQLLSDSSDGLTITITPAVARALLAAEPFDATDASDWIEGRDALLKALDRDGGTD
jgi:hypothetical protein